MTRSRDICFDLDDTLIPNSYLYNAPAWECGLLISRALGPKCPYWSALAKRQEEIDKANIPAYGFSRHRFPHSWVQLYEELCANAGVTADPSLAERLRATAGAFADGPFVPYDDVCKTLAALKARGHRLHLVTAGDEGLQRTKIREADLERFFCGVHITAMDKRTVLESIVGSAAAASVMVGDSKKGDILPALALGMTAVWIPGSTWDHVHADIEDAHFHTVGAIGDVLTLVDSFNE